MLLLLPADAAAVVHGEASGQAVVFVVVVVVVVFCGGDDPDGLERPVEFVQLLDVVLSLSSSPPPFQRLNVVSGEFTASVQFSVVLVVGILHVKNSSKKSGIDSVFTLGR